MTPSPGAEPMTSPRPPRGLHTTIRCSTCHTPIPLSPEQAEGVRLTLRTHAACAVCGMSGEYSLLGGRPTRTVTDAPPSSPPPFAPLPTAADRPRAPAAIPHFAPAALPTAAPPPAAPYFCPVATAAPPKYRGPRPSLGERWKGLSKGRQWAVTVALVVVAGVIVILMPTGSGHPPAEPPAQTLPR
jgi:hypothetical protein